jgi:hypothetical protein
MRGQELAADLLAEVWAHRGWSERAMAARYRELARVAAAGPWAAVAPALAAAADDELAHAELCDEACRVLGGTPSTAGLPALEPVGDLLLELAVTCCLGETLNVVLLQDELATCEDRWRPITRRLLADELVHARLGWSVLGSAAGQYSLAYLAAPLSAVLAEAMARPSGPAGVLDPARRAALLDAALYEVVLPGLARHGIDCVLEHEAGSA